MPKLNAKQISWLEEWEKSFRQKWSVIDCYNDEKLNQMYEELISMEDKIKKNPYAIKWILSILNDYDAKAKLIEVEDGTIPL